MRSRFKAEEEREGGEQDDQSGKSSFSWPRLELCEEGKEEEEDEVGEGRAAGEEGGEGGDGENRSWI